MIAAGDVVALEITWKGRVMKALPPFSAGTQLSAQIAIFLSFRDEKIVSQTDYPCYDPIAEIDSQ
jgi:ketosteroid isomerase-like protein